MAPRRKTPVMPVKRRASQSATARTPTRRRSMLSDEQATQLGYRLAGMVDPQSVSCPTCGAQPQMPCKSLPKKDDEFHRRRYRQAGLK